MKGIDPRKFFKERVKQKKINPYIEFMGQIISCQSHIRRYLAVKKYKKLLEEDAIIERIAAAHIIQNIYRNHTLRKKESIEIQNMKRSSIIIKRSIKNFLRRKRLDRFKRFFNSIIIQRRVKIWLQSIRYQPIPDQRPFRPTSARSLLDQFIQQRQERQRVRDHNRETLNRRLENIRLSQINSLNSLTRPVGTGLRRPSPPRRIEIPQLRPLSPPRRLVTPQNRLELPRPQQNINGIRNHLEQLEREFLNPQIRRIYEENNVILPTGHRVLPGRQPGRLRLEPTNIQITEIHDPPGVEKQDCMICMESVAITRFINIPCNHKICNICVKNMIRSAVGNVATEIPVKCPDFHNGCTTVITPDTQGIRSILSNSDFLKFEKYSILKQHIPVERLRYCPNFKCEMPYELLDHELPESSPKTIQYKYYLSCSNCDTKICTYCNDFWHEGISCHLFKLNKGKNDAEDKNYIRKYCKQCPKCSSNVQKQQTEEQEEYEKRTGMSGGTKECHHVTCGACKTDFCWTCLKIYKGNEYYHRNCPNSDCIIHFINGYPSISHMPIGQITHIKLIIYNGEIIKEEKVFSINNRNPILNGSRIYKLDQSTVYLHCSHDGIVKRLEGFTGDYTFRQENKAVF